MFGVIALLVGSAGYLYLRGEHVRVRSARANPPIPELRALRGAPDYIPAGQRLEFSISGVYEDTLPAMERAVARGMPALALELRLSRDGVLVVCPDETLERITGVAGRVDERTVAELKQLDAGDGARIPTLEEVFVRFGDRVRYQLEIDDGRLSSPYATMLVDMLKGYPLARRVAIASPHPWLLGRIEAKAPELETELIASDVSWISGLWTALGLSHPDRSSGREGVIDLQRLDRWLNFYPIDSVQLPVAAIDAEVVAHFHARGVALVARDVRDGGVGEALARLGVDGMTTWFTGWEEPPPAVAPLPIEGRAFVPRESK
jgi:glycerophosphoryl diester phosphodiesterase